MESYCAPLDGTLLTLIDFVDFHAEHNPDSPWALYPSSDATATSISFSEVARATHRVARGLRPDGPSGGRDVVVMLIHCDTILYVTMLVGIARSGMVVCYELNSWRPTDTDNFTSLSPCLLAFPLKPLRIS